MHIKSSWFFTIWKTVVSVIWRPKPQELQEFSRSNLYRTCRHLTMDRFLDCLCEGKLDSLIIDGAATTTELQEAWVMILSEYYDLKGDEANGADFWQLTREIMRIEQHLVLLNECLQFLGEAYSESVAYSLRRLGYSFRPTDKTPSTYLHLLKAIASKAGKKKMELARLMKELTEKVSKISENVGNPDRSDFDRMLIYIEEMQKTTYDLTAMPVYKYVMLEKKYWQQIEALKAKQQR